MSRADVVTEFNLAGLHVEREVENFDVARRHEHSASWTGRTTRNSLGSTVHEALVVLVGQINTSTQGNEHSARLPVNCSVVRYQNAYLLELLDHVLRPARHQSALFHGRIHKAYLRCSVHSRLKTYLFSKSFPP